MVVWCFVLLFIFLFFNFGARKSDVNTPHLEHDLVLNFQQAMKTK